MTVVRPVRSFLFAVFVLALVTVAMPAGAQGIVSNPRAIAFSPSEDHNAVNSNGEAVVTTYALEIFPAGADLPVIVLNLGKPAPARDGIISVDFTSLLASPPMPGLPLEARVAAIGPDGRGESGPSNPFQFDGPPSPSPATPAPSLTSLSVRITQPAYGTTLHFGASVTISAVVSGAVSGVDFYANGRPIGTATSAPYSVSWRSSVAGKFAITAVTVDRNGVQAASSPVVVTLGRVPPPKSVPDGKATSRK